jgi:hypothetical protein
MTIDIERELRLAMQQHTDDILAPPDLLDRVRPDRRRVRPRLTIALAAGVAAVTVAAVALVARGVGVDGDGGADVRPLSTYHLPSDYGQREQQAAAQMNSAVANWGTTRGDKADDQQLMSQLRDEWAHPTSHPPEQGQFEAVISPDGPVKVLWAGTTPEGVAALAVQHTKDPVAQWWYGFFVTTTSGHVRLAQRSQLVAGYDFGEPDPHLLSFAPVSHKTVIAVPVDPSDSIRMTFRSQPDATGYLHPQWTDVTVHDGAAVATVPAGGDVWDTVIEVRHDGQTVADDQVDYVDTANQNDGPPHPANVLEDLWCNACTVGGAGEAGYGLAMLEAWGVRHGPAYLRIMTSMWSMGAKLRDGSPVFITQMWQPGGQGHTVAIADERSKNEVEVLYDETTSPTDRPLVAIRLPERSGWVIGSGPNAVVTGWRADGGSWHDVASKKALLLPTDASTLQLRLLVSGHEQVVTRTAG